MAVIYRAEVIGSLVRPAYLNDGRAAMHAGKLSAQEFKQLEDRAVDEVLALQERVGMDVVSDGEMRRMIYQVPGSGTMKPHDGPSPVTLTLNWRKQEGAATAAQRAQIPVFPLTSRLSPGHAAAAEFAYAQAHTRKPVKITMPGPTAVLNRWSPAHSGQVYPTPLDLLNDAVEVIKQEVRELAALGCRYVQIDAPELSNLTGASQAVGNAIPNYNEWLRNEGLAAINAVATVPGVTFGLHVCRGNYKGYWLSETPWEQLAQHIFPRTTNFDIFLLEYDDWRSGSFAPLADLGRDKVAVLGLLSTKRKELEPADQVAARITEASRFFPLERMALSSQCGFSPDSLSNVLDWAGQEAKLRLVAEIAHRVWS